jgi:hypothetical protein
MKQPACHGRPREMTASCAAAGLQKPQPALRNLQRARFAGSI